jgi:hypothetical protein
LYARYPCSFLPLGKRPLSAHLCRRIERRPLYMW